MANYKARGLQGQNDFVAIKDGTLCLQPSGTPGIPMISTCTDTSAIMYTQQRIHELMRDLQEKILALENYPQWDFYQIIGPGWKDKVQGGFTKRSSLRNALQHDLKMLHHLLQQLPREAQKIRRLGLQVSAQESSRQFVRAFQKAVKGVDELDSNTLSQLRSKSEAALSSWIKAVKDNPSTKNMAGLTNELSRNQLNGFDDGSLKVNEAWDALEEAGKTRKQRAEQTFMKNPTSANLQNYLKEAGMNELLGGEGFTLNLPAGLKRLRPEKQYNVKAGETLSEISKLFYGSTIYWPVLYVANFGLIGNNPDKLPGNITIEIL